MCTALLEEEETQIGGFAAIVDYSGVTMKHTAVFSVQDVVDFANIMKSAVGRHKQFYLVNLPAFANFLLETAKSAISEKLRKRITTAKSMEDLGNYLDVSLLPKEFGGILSEEEHMEEFNVYFRSVRPNLEEIKAKVIDWNKVPKMSQSAAEAVGSFRKLEID